MIDEFSDVGSRVSTGDIITGGEGSRQKEHDAQTENGVWVGGREGASHRARSDWYAKDSK